MSQMNEFKDGWWNCFISFANELCMTERYGDKVVRDILNGAGIEVYEIDWALEDFDEIMVAGVKEELLRYKDRKLFEV